MATPPYRWPPIPTPSFSILGVASEGAWLVLMTSEKPTTIAANMYRSSESKNDASTFNKKIMDPQPLPPFLLLFFFFFSFNNFHVRPIILHGHGGQKFSERVGLPVMEKECREHLAPRARRLRNKTSTTLTFTKIHVSQ